MYNTIRFWLFFPINRSNSIKIFWPLPYSSQFKNSQQLTAFADSLRSLATLSSCFTRAVHPQGWDSMPSQWLGLPSLVSFLLTQTSHRQVTEKTATQHKLPSVLRLYNTFNKGHLYIYMKTLGPWKIIKHYVASSTTERWMNQDRSSGCEAMERTSFISILQITSLICKLQGSI